jgi:hypothetical protein
VTKSAVRLPNLVVPGLPHAGTTWLHRVLSSHPDVFLPRRKEVHYFDRNYAKGPEWYAKYFEGAGDRRVLVDITPTYVFRPTTPERIASDLPGAKVVIVLRHPVTWLLSTFLKLQREYGTGRTTFARFVAKPGRIDDYRAHWNLGPYVRALGGDRVHFVYYEDLAKDPAAYLRGFCEFVGIDAEPIVAAEGDRLGRKENPAVKPRSAAVHRVLHGVIRRARRVQWSWLDMALDAGRNLYRRTLSTESSTEKMAVDPAARAAVIRAFQPEVAQLSKVTGRDLVRFWSLAD